jgi:hypothetical protein
MDILSSTDKTVDALMKLELPAGDSPLFPRPSVACAHAIPSVLRCTVRSAMTVLPPYLTMALAQRTSANRAGTGSNMKNRRRMRALSIILALGTSVTWASPGFWMPFSATPVMGTTGGTSGLFVIPSFAVGSSPAPKPSFITTAEPTLLGATFTLVGTFTAPTSVTPALLIYSAKGADGNLHLYGLNLTNPTNSSTPPKPVQITNLSVKAPNVICAAGQSQSNLTVPSTLSVVIHVATPTATSSCASAPTGTYYLAAYTNSATTAPTVLKIPGGTSTLSAITNDGSFVALNNQPSGLLGGILYWDSVTHDENFYSTPAGFNSAPSKVPVTGVKGTPLACIGASSFNSLNHLGGDYLAAVNTAKGYVSYVFTPAGAANEFFAGQASDCVTDATHLYFLGTATGGTTGALYQETLSSLTAPLTLLPGVTSSGTLQYSLIGSNTAVVVIDKNAFAGTTFSTTLETVPVGVKSTSAKTIAGPYAGATLWAGFLAAPAGQPAIDDQLFVSLRSETFSGTPKVTYSSHLLAPSGVSILTPPANTVWQAFGPLTNELNGEVLEITGITDTDGGYGGASLHVWPVGHTSGLAITLTGGASYKVPATYVLSAAGFYGTAIAEGALISATNQPSMGVAINASKTVIVPFSFLKTSVLPML